MARARSTGRFPRALRVNQVLRQILADEIERFADSDERLALTTVTSVEIAEDLATATIFFDNLTPARIEALEERRGRLQHAVNSQLKLKRTPKLVFIADPAIASGARIDALLRKVASREGGTEDA